MSEYPGDERQGGMYAIQYLRWVLESGVVTEIGPAAYTLLSVIVMREDSLHYRRPPNYWQSQLMDQCGFQSRGTLATAIKKLVSVGLLNYQPGDKGSPGVYFTSGFCSKIEAQTGGTPENDVQKSKRNQTSNAHDTPNDVQKSKRKCAPPNPTPINPTPNPRTAAQCDRDFEIFWELYPSRGGRKQGKAAAKKIYQKLGSDDREQVLQATKALAASGQLPKDAHRFLKPDVWREWLEPLSKPTQPATTTPPSKPDYTQDEARRMRAERAAAILAERAKAGQQVAGGAA